MGQHSLLSRGTILDEFKSQARRAMKEPMIEDPVYKKLFSSIIDSIKLNKMQYIGHKTSIKSVQEYVESVKSSQANLFDQRLPALTMLNLAKKLKEESKLADRIEKLEIRVDTMEDTLKAILDEIIHQSKILTKLLVAQTSNPNDNKKGEKDESLSKPQTQKPENAAGGPSNPNIESEAAVKSTKRKRLSTQTQRHEKRKRQRLPAEERRREREASIILDKQEQEKTLADLKEKTQKIDEAVHVGNFKEIIDKSKQHVNTEDQRRGRDEATLKLIEKLIREYEEEEKLKTDVK